MYTKYATNVLTAYGGDVLCSN